MQTIVFKMCLFFLSLAINASDIFHTWHQGEDSFTIKTVEYETTLVEQFNAIACQFHLSDEQAMKAKIVRFGSTNAYQEYLKNFIGDRAKKLLAKELSLVLLYKNNEVVGGGYLLKEDDQYIRLSCAGFDAEKIGISSTKAQQKFMDTISDKKYYPASKTKLILFLPKASCYEQQVLASDFKASDYTRKDYIDNYNCFERLLH